MTIGLFDLRPEVHRAAVRCLCFPYAGGTHAVFSAWQSLFGADADVFPVRLPGRGIRYNETPYYDFDVLMRDLTLALAPILDRPYILFGHSLGALIAHELGRRLQLVYGRAPLHLFAAGCRAPHSARPGTATIRAEDHELGDREMAKKLDSLGGIPRAIVEDEELLRITLGAVRADFKVYQSITPSVRRVHWPITAYGGTEDLAEVPIESLKAWADMTSAPFAMHLLPGDHFFLNTNQSVIVSNLRQLCRQGA